MTDETDNTNNDVPNNDVPNTEPAPPAPPAPGAAGAPVATGIAPTPPRRGLPGWAWALIAGCAVVMIAVIAVVALVVSTIVGTVAREDQGGGQQPAPVTDAASDAASTAEATAPAGSTGGVPAADGVLIGLEDQADLGPTFPIWRYPMPSGWEITTFDQEGINTSENAELGCLFTSSQNKQPAVDPAATDDLTDTLATMEVLENRMLDGTQDAELIGDLDITEITLEFPEGEGSLEFVTSRIDYLDTQLNVPYTTEIAARAMPLAESLMYVVVTCPTALVDAGGSPFDDLREDLAVLVEATQPE